MSLDHRKGQVNRQRAALSSATGQAAERAIVESLEGRQLLSASVVGTTLMVEGSKKADKIYFSYSKDSTKYVITIGKKAQQFARKGIRTLNIEAKGGGDTVNITQTTGKLKVRIFGGSGNDLILGHNGKEIVDAGLGNDTVTGAGGSDKLTGGDGDDFIVGGSAHDKLFGDAGHDLLYGDAGNDRVNGGDGDDTLGGDDEDVLSFSSPIDNDDAVGKDRLDGGAGDDVLLSGVKTQSIPDSSGQDTFIGGSGADVLDARGGDDSLADLADEDFVPTSDFTPVSHTNVLTHEHATVRIFVRAKGGYAQVVIPAEIGIFGASQMAHLHTHAFDGVIHFESATAGDTYRLGDFFRMWGITFDSRHIGRYVNTKARKVTMKVDGVKNTQFDNYQPKNSDKIDIFVG